MHRILKSVTGALASACIAASAAAAPLPQEGTLGTGAAPQSAIEPAQFIFGGREYCWYPDGWHGPGFYWCGYAWRRGFGWGGGEGWRGWHRGGPGPGFHGRPGPGFHGRPGPGRPGPKGPPPKHH
jgi:hypothetical protein